jgi:hypothetical protein
MMYVDAAAPRACRRAAAAALRRDQRVGHQGGRARGRQPFEQIPPAH